MADLLEQLRQSLGSAYSIEREIHGGGMSRVFLAEETQFERKVVIKVLSPELSAGISAERFEREIKLAAQLQQANIVAVHAAGESRGLPYYTMPFVEGESLRTRLGRGQLSLSEVVTVLRDTARSRLCARQGSRPPRHQAGKYSALRRSCGRHGFRNRESRVGVEDQCARRNVDRRRHVSWNARLHGARASGRRYGRSARRYLCVGIGGVRDSRRRASIRRQAFCATMDHSAAHGKTGTDTATTKWIAKGACRDRDALSREGAGEQAADGERNSSSSR